MQESQQPRKLRLILGVSGSVAAIKLEELAERLSTKVDLLIVVTQAAKHFIDKHAKWGSQAIEDEADWRLWRNKGNPVQHIELRKWADFMLIAPLSANTLAKMAHGLCDNLLTSIVRAWDMRKPILVAPAMNTLMWENPVTEEHLQTLRKRHNHHFKVIKPMAKTLACGDTGMGAMATVEDIDDLVAALKKILQHEQNRAECCGADETA